MERSLVTSVATLRKQSGAWVFLNLIILALCIETHAAGPFTVNSLNDTHAVNPAVSAVDSGGGVSLRSALEAANAQPSPTTIILPAGTYNLSLGELSVAPNGNKTIVISGAGANTTIVSQTDGSNRVFNIDFNSVGSTFVTLSGMTVRGGRDIADGLGGAGILAGSITSVPKDTLTLSNCVVRDNLCRTNTTQEPGGGIQMAGGDLVLTGCSFSNNFSGQSFGGAVFLLAQSVVSSLRVTNSVFLNNGLTNNSGAGPNGGGAIMLMTPVGSVHQVVGSTFHGNRVVGNAGSTYGGAIQINGGTLNISSSTFVSNSVSGPSGLLGGAIYVDSGTLNLGYCRLAGNTATLGGSAVYSHGSNGAITIATNNWWGCNSGPGPAGCNVVAGDGGVLSYEPWIVLSTTASPAAINRGGSTTFTASVLRNSANQTLTPAQLPVLLGLPLTWNNAANGSLTAAQTTIQPNGLATATFSNNNTCGPGGADVSLDGGTATAFVAINCADMIVAKNNNVSATIPLGGSWMWTVQVTNSGSIAAPFADGAPILLDNLPTANITYGPPMIVNASGVSGAIVPAIDGSGNLVCSAGGAVNLQPGASFAVQFTATPTLAGTFGNPRSGGLCMVDPDNHLFETSKVNNTATNFVVVTCPLITASVSGGGTTCPGGLATVLVAVSGGQPPYSVTLDNGGGTQSGYGPFVFNVSPPVTTTYQVAAGSDSQGCPLTGSGSASVTVTSLVAPVITLSPGTVLANSGGNQASATAGFATYAWTITNGVITSAANLPAITYVAGPSNRVGLGLVASLGPGCSASASVSAPVITGFSIHTNVTFIDGLGETTTGIAFDGTNYWTCSGGSTVGPRLARYSLTGALLGTYSPGLDFRCVFTRPDGTLLAREYNSGIIYRQTSPGVFTNSGVTLTGGALDSQATVVLNSAGTEFHAVLNGVVSRWGTNGTYLGSTSLKGFGSVSDENAPPQNHGLAVGGGFWLTYNGNGILSAWDAVGNRVLQESLPLAGTNFDSNFSFGFANGKFFVVDAAGELWRGYDFFTAASVAVLAAETMTEWNTDVTRKIAAAGAFPRVDFLRVYSSDPVPTAAQLRNYQGVLVYSDFVFNDATALGNLLADYIDQGGGVVQNTFVFASGVGLGFGGRMVSGGYLPFTTGGYDSPGNLTLVKDLPQHPLLSGVNALNGGSSSYHNSPISIAAGAALVAHWSNGQPLVGAKEVGSGRSAGLNFFPPSSDAFAQSWVSGTDGARLMANALSWAGRIPPVIVVPPVGQLVAPGGTVSFQVIAEATPPLAYQWRLNGTNIAGATGSALSFAMQPNSAGVYSVAVSNLYGTTISVGAALNSPLRFLSPVVSGTALSLLLGNADGNPVAPERASRVAILASTDLAAPSPAWMMLSNAVVPVSGLLRVDGLSVTNAGATFFRAVEAP